MGNIFKVLKGEKQNSIPMNVSSKNKIKMRNASDKI